MPIRVCFIKSWHLWLRFASEFISLYAISATLLAQLFLCFSALRDRKPLFQIRAALSYRLRAKRGRGSKSNSHCEEVAPCD